MESGDEDPIVALLLLLLTHVKSLEIFRMGSTSSKFFRMLSVLASTPGLDGLSKLTKVTIGGEPGKKPLSMLNRFACLPSVRRIDVTGLTRFDHQNERWCTLSPG